MAERCLLTIRCSESVTVSNENYQITLYLIRDGTLREQSVAPSYALGNVSLPEMVTSKGSLHLVS